MNAKTVLSISMLFLLSISGLLGKPPSSQAVAAKPRPTGAQIAKIENPDHFAASARAEKEARDASVRNQAPSPVEVVPEAAKTRPAVEGRSTQGTILERSMMLSDGKNWTIVPRGAVLHVPGRFKHLVGGNNAGKLITWPQFYQRNRGWLYAHPVTMAQARGEDLVTIEQQKAYVGTNRVVVAVFKHGPISVLEGALEPAPTE